MSPFQKWLLVVSSALTGLTGVVYWGMQHLLPPPDGFAVVNHPLQPWVLKAHILVAPVLVFAVGLVALEHVWKHLRTAVRSGRRSGTAMVWVLAPMVLTGYLIQAVTHAGWLTALVWAHVGTGVLYLGGMAAHLVVLRSRGAAARRSLPDAAGPVGLRPAPRRRRARRA